MPITQRAWEQSRNILRTPWGHDHGKRSRNNIRSPEVRDPFAHSRIIRCLRVQDPMLGGVNDHKDAQTEGT
jgi:hypothetical protein